MIHVFPLFDSFHRRNPGSISHNDALLISTQNMVLFRSYFMYVHPSRITLPAFASHTGELWTLGITLNLTASGKHPAIRNLSLTDQLSLGLARNSLLFFS